MTRAMLVVCFVLAWSAGAGAQPTPESAPASVPASAPAVEPLGGEIPCQGDCLARRACGNGIRQMREECDAGEKNSDSEPNACRTNCRYSWCGDGVVDAAEQCDAGADNGRGACSVECLSAVCGNGLLEFGESCDDGNLRDGDGCGASCQTPPASLAALSKPLYSPTVAMTLSGIPTAAGYGALVTGLVLRAQENPGSAGWLAAGLAGTIIGPSFGRMYIGDWNKAGLYTGARVLSLGAVLLGLGISDQDEDSDLDSQLILGGGAFFLLLSAGDVLLVGRDAKTRPAPGGVQPLFTVAPLPLRGANGAPVAGAGFSLRY